jgi:hypothetical protein
MNDFDNNQQTLTEPRGLHTHEVAEFRQWRDDRIRQAAIAEAQAKVSAQEHAREAAADAAALKKLEDKGVSLKDCFGNSTTQRGRNVLVNISRTAFSSKSGDYARLRRIARGQGLVQ